MLAGFYTAASGLLVQQRNINVIGNNMTNSQTVGFRTQRLVQSTFEHDYLTRYENGVYEYIGEGDPATLVDVVETNFDYASLEDSDFPYDMALVGDGYFNIQGQNRQYMTRNGNFNIDEEGYLVLEGIGRVLGENGTLQIGGSDFTVTQDGYVFDNQNQYVDKLLISATDISVEEVPSLVGEYDGICYPAHIDRSSFSILSNLGVIDEYFGFKCAEIFDITKEDELKQKHPYLNQLKILSDSDAHYLENMRLPQQTVDVAENTVKAILDYLNC